MTFSTILSLFLSFAFVQLARSDCKGCVGLDDYNFHKIVPKFDAVLVKFDIAYPYGDKHDTYIKLAEELNQNDNIIVAEVGVKDYGDKENEKLAAKYKIAGKDDFPVVKLFLKSTEKYVDFPKTSAFTVENLRNHIRDNSDLYIGLPGCIEKYDKYAQSFANSKDRKALIELVEKESKKETDEDVKSRAKTYNVYMKKIVEVGNKFIKEEKSRLGKLIKDGKINEKKKAELSVKLNILHSFKAVKEEL